MSDHPQLVYAVFGKFKGRNSNYLSKSGYDLKTGQKKANPQPAPADAKAK